MDFSRGAEWRRWDLHLHTPGTKLSNNYGSVIGVWDKYIDLLENSPVQAFGITDYFSADSYFELISKYKVRYPKTKKVFFPNVEFRLVESPTKSGEEIHAHVIFDNEVSQDEIRNFLSDLKLYGSAQSGSKKSCLSLKTPDDYVAASVTMTDIEQALKTVFGDNHPYLIACPAKNNGMKATDTKSPRKIDIADKVDHSCHLFFGSHDSRDWFLRRDRYESGESEPKPVVSGSDAHSLDDLERLEGNVVGFPPTWIKADLTFRGLQQICFEPADRVIIGKTPPVIDRQEIDATKFVSFLTIDPVSGYDGSKGTWFKDTKISFNPELTAIIGNKGSGKSALVDIIGLLADSEQSEYFSFLSNKPGNKKFKQKGYAENFSACIAWLSGTTTCKNLDAIVDKNKPESVRYLPQNYFEKLTNEIEIEQFREEIEDVVFSHVEETDRMSKKTFSELQDFKTQQSLQEISLLKTKLRELNIQIVQLEGQADPSFKAKISEKLNTKRLELASVIKAEPASVPKPSDTTPEQQASVVTIAKWTELREKLAQKGTSVSEAIEQAKGKHQKLTAFLETLQGIEGNLLAYKSELTPTALSLGFDINAIIEAKVDTSKVQSEIKRVKSQIQKLEKDNALNFDNGIDPDKIESLPDLRSAYKYLGQKIDEEREKLGAPQRKFQAYLDKLKEWNNRKKQIQGEIENPKGDTINYLESQLRYIDEDLSPMLVEKYDSRKKLTQSIFNSKKKILDFYTELKKSVEDRLSAVRTDGFSVDIDAAFVLSSSFSQEFLGHINKKKRGFFQGASDSQLELKSMTSEVEWNDFESVNEFIQRIVTELKDTDKGAGINEQVFDVKEFYDYLYSLEYFSAKYELKSAGKNLNELSPGEKGLLLLVFYLQLDKDNIPLVIDQPEDNLDNDSIFAVLAECIRQAKQRRQVILVTHNPNLAVGADAEQIIYVKLDKADHHKFSFESGSIENPSINERIIQILEGSQPAFIKRRLKYAIA